MAKPAILKYDPKVTVLTPYHGFHIETPNHLFQFPPVGPETPYHGFVFNLEVAAKKISAQLDSHGRLVLRFEEE